MRYENRLTLRPLQELHCQQTQAQPATLIAQPLGAGKTTVAVEAVYRQFGTRPHRVLVVAKGNTRYGWERTVRRQYQNYTDPTLFRRIDSSKSGKQNMDALWDGEPGWYVVTWEYFTLRPPHFWDKLKVDVIILDEVQRMQNRKSKTWSHMQNVGKTAKRIALSATPGGNKMEGLWTTLRWLFPEDEDASLYTTPRSFWRWVSDWLTQEEDEYLGFVVVGGERFDQGTMLSYYPSYIRDSDAVDVEEVNEIIVDTPLSMVQRKLYREVEKEAITWLKSVDPETGTRPLVVELPLQVRMRLRQITLGEPSIDETGTVTFVPDMRSSKIDAILDILESDLDPGEPVLVLTHSRAFAVAAADRLTVEGYPAWAWVGGTSEKRRLEVVESWGKPNGPQVIVAVIEAIAEGIDGLQFVCHNEIWASESENMLMNVQARGRLPRQGQPHRVNRWRLIAPGTYDEGIISDHIQRLLDLNASLRGK